MDFKSILRTFLKIILPLAFGCLLLWFLYRKMDITEIWRVVKEGVRYDIILVSLLFGLFANISDQDIGRNKCDKGRESELCIYDSFPSQ